MLNTVIYSRYSSICSLKNFDMALSTGSVPEGGSLTKLYVSSDIYTKLYETTLLPNSQQCNDSRRFSVTAASTSNMAEIISSSKPVTKSALRPSKSLEVKTSESETDDDLLVRDDSNSSDDKDSAAKALAEQTKARAAYFTLISDSALDSDTIQPRTSLKGICKHSFSILLQNNSKRNLCIFFLLHSLVFCLLLHPFT